MRCAAHVGLECETMSSLPAMEAYVRNETRISVVINAVISAVVFLVVFGLDGPVQLWGFGQWIADFLPQSFMTTFMSVLVPGALARRKLKAGALTRIGHRSFLPAKLLPRGLILAVGSAFIGTASIAVFVWLVGAPSIAPVPALVLKAMYGAGLALIVTPLSLRAELAS
nr:hypothetical protein [Novosphingobium sp. SG916]